MVGCERCHRKFESYAALLDHYKVKHPNVSNLDELHHSVVSEKETQLIYETSIQHSAHGSSHLKLLAFVLIVIIAISVSSYVAFAPKASVQLGAAKSIGVGAKAPDFSLPTTSGQNFRLSDYLGKFNVLLFFNEGLACQPCLTQMQSLDSLNSQFNSLNVVVVSITGDSLQTLKDWAQSSGPRYGLVLSDQNLQVSRMYDMLGPSVSMMPGLAPGHSFILVNNDGVIVWRQDYGPYNMSVPNGEIIAAVKQALGK